MRRGVRKVWLGAACVVLAASCGSSGSGSGGAVTQSADDDPAAATLPADRWPADELHAPTPFTVDGLPDGFEVEVAGEGDAEPYLSDDNSGTIEPSLLVVPDTWDGQTRDGIVRVSAVDYSGLEGAFGQATGYGQPTRRFEVDGRPAVYEAASERYGIEIWPQVAIDLGDGWAIRVSGPGATEELLVELAQQARLDDHHLPVLTSIPAGRRVASRITAEQVEAADGAVTRTREGSVDVNGYAVVYARSYPAPDDPNGPYHPEDRLVFTSVPGSSANIEAVAWLRSEAGHFRGWGDDWSDIAAVEALDVGGRVGLYSPTLENNLLVFTTADDGLMILSSSGDAPLGRDELASLAQRVTPVDVATWTEWATELEGGPGFHADPRRTELARGEVDGMGWLLQSSNGALLLGGTSGGPGTEDFVGGANFPVPPQASPDACIKLESGDRVCIGGGTGSSARYDRQGDGSKVAGPYFDVVLVKPVVAQVRVATNQRSFIVDTAPLPGTTVRLYVLAFAPDEAATEVTRLDAAGAVVPPEAAR